MPTAPPKGNQQDYTQRPPRVYAEQYRAGDPLPPGAIEAIEPIYPAATGPYVNTSTGVHPLHDTDWVLTDPATGLPMNVLSDADFQAQYVKATGAAPA